MFVKISTAPATAIRELFELAPINLGCRGHEDSVDTWFDGVLLPLGSRVMPEHYRNVTILWKFYGTSSNRARSQVRFYRRMRENMPFVVIDLCEVGERNGEIPFSEPDVLAALWAAKRPVRVELMEIDPEAMRQFGLYRTGYLGRPSWATSPLSSEELLRFFRDMVVAAMGFVRSLKGLSGFLTDSGRVRLNPQSVEPIVGGQVPWVAAKILFGRTSLGEFMAEFENR